MKKWEHKVLTATMPPDEELLEQFSKEGYELVSTVFFAMTGNWYTYFKRPIEEEVNSLLQNQVNLSEIEEPTSTANNSFTSEDDIPF